MVPLVLVLLLAKVGSSVNDSITPLKLLEKGFRNEEMALIVLIEFPFQLVSGYLASQFCSGPNPLRPVSLFSDPSIIASDLSTNSTCTGTLRVSCAVFSECC